MWIALIAGWVLGSVALYAWLVRSAREPANQECMECHLLDCAECPMMRQQEAASLKRAA